MKLRITTLAVLVTLAAGAAQAQAADPARAVEQILQRNAAEQTGIAGDLAQGRIDAQTAAALQGRQADLYGIEAVALDRSVQAQDMRRLQQAQQRVTVLQDRRVLAAEKAAERTDAQHERVAALRDAEQERAIARGLASGHLTMEQVAQLQAGQARLTGLQLRADGDGHETIDQALRLSHLRDIQDWAIATARPTF